MEVALGLTDCPTGKSLLIFRNHVKSQNQKYSARCVGQITFTISASCPEQRDARDRQERGAGRGGREGARQTSGTICVRQNRVVLTPRCWRQVSDRLTLIGGDGGKKAGHQDDHV